jgi:PAS domain S-box-containing protein
MQTITQAPNPQPKDTPRSEELLHAHQNAIHRRTDRLFANLMVIQWIAGIAAALWISPKTWIGAQSQTHLHVWAAILLGGAITSLPVLLARTRPGWVVTRHVIAVGQMLTSALLIHLTGGRVETHFHVFGSLAFLAIYRDWRVLLTATVVTAADHFARGIFWPQSVFGVLAASPWRSVEHAAWVLFEDTFLWISIRQKMVSMREAAVQHATLEDLNATFERQVADRTEELALALRGLQTSEQRYRMLSESAPIGIFEADHDGRVLYFNPQWQKISGLTLDESLGDGWQKAMHPDDFSRIVGPWLEAAREGSPFDAEYRYRRPDGEVRWVHIRSVAVRSDAGWIVGQVGTIEDVTDRKRAEAELEKMYDELMKTSRQAGMAEVATAVLHNVGNVLNSVNVASTCVADSLRKSKATSLTRVVALLREHEADLGAFFTHDPRSKNLPSFLAQLSEQLAADQAAALRELAQLQKNIEHIKEIVALQQGYAKVSGATETVQMAELVEDTLCMNTESFAHHALRVEREFDEVPPIAVEKHKVLQILVNLVRNAKHACDAMERPDKTLTLRVFNGDGRVKVAVSDNGIGIPAENLTRIFNHGFTTKKDGHGFGLHSCALAAQEMGGALRVESRGPGQGATFTLELPEAAAHKAHA